MISTYKKISLRDRANKPNVSHIDPQHPINDLAPYPLTQLWTISNELARVPDPSGLEYLRLTLVGEMADKQRLQDVRQRRDEGEQMGEK